MSEIARDFLAHQLTISEAAMALVALPPFQGLNRQADLLEEEFMSGGPPMSPIYDSYSVIHLLAEIPVGMAGETPMGVLARLTATSPQHRELHLLALQFASSHLDLYRALSVTPSTAHLVHLRSGRKLDVHLTGPFLRESDLFLARVIPFRESEQVISESPYLLLTAEAEWLAYLDRVWTGRPGAAKKMGKSAPSKQKGPSRNEVLVKHLREGSSFRFWPEFFVNAYADERNGIVKLIGIPDRPATQPHHPSFDARSFAADGPRVIEEVTPLEGLRRKLFLQAEQQGLVARLTQTVRRIAGDESFTPEEQPCHFLFRSLVCFAAPTDAGCSLVEAYRSSGKVTPEEQPLVEGLLRGWFSLFTVRRVHLDRELEVTDVLKKSRLTIVEKSATRQIGVGDGVIGMVMQDEAGAWRLEGGVLHVSAMQVPSVSKLAKQELERRVKAGHDPHAPSTLASLIPELMVAVREWILAWTQAQSDLTKPGSSSLPGPMPPEFHAPLLKRLWAALDEPIPMFRNKTLRQLAKGPKTRPDAIAWLRQQERIFRDGPAAVGLDMRPLWAELGLEYQGLDTDPS